MKAIYRFFLILVLSIGLLTGCATYPEVYWKTRQGSYEKSVDGHVEKGKYEEKEATNVPPGGYGNVSGGAYFNNGNVAVGVGTWPVFVGGGICGYNHAGQQLRCGGPIAPSNHNWPR